ncbi:MAG: SGNH/GDSL hydrolase family protein [Nitrospirota bacterium]|nr:SGNH/GDSL hydrolase family protein [Nitrospirota bacterium]
MTRKPFRKLLGAACVLLITLIALEVAVRVWGYSERHIYDPIYTSFDRTEDIPYIPKPNLREARARGLAMINTDSLGLRAKIAGGVYGAKQPNEYRIALVGDSCTFGEGVTRTEDTFAQVLEDKLNQQQQAVTVKVFNYGASAYSVKEMAATLQYRMVDIQPDFVVMAIISADFNLSRTPVIDSVGYLVDKRVSFPHDSPVRDGLRGVHLLYVLRDVVLSWISPSGDSAVSLSRGEIPESYRYIQQFRGLAEQRGLPCLIVLLPKQGANVWGSLPARLRQDAVKYIDLSPFGNEFTREQYMGSRFDPHPSAAVHHRIGEALADYVRHQPGFAL